MISLIETREERHKEMKAQAEDPEGLDPTSSQIGCKEYPERPSFTTLGDRRHKKKVNGDLMCTI